ncbi:hypothetical protein EGR_11131 [Echinococcus granulosus]|uniref:Uncharacterized protein n=1 Tax=Echinococcus granulosus TaxID=6210 RepID=W6U6R1_ECHGR|nr:hypothetical protein EGR_11131 [Echinococcus granulosus]EUB54012.1 hypothetical protein EGR_11131 [Echinococcus granulosus]
MESFPSAKSMILLSGTIRTLPTGEEDIIFTTISPATSIPTVPTGKGEGVSTTSGVALTSVISGLVFVSIVVILA